MSYDAVVPPAIADRFQAAILARLGIDPATVTNLTVAGTWGDPYARITIDARLPLKEVEDMFNNEGKE